MWRSARAAATAADEQIVPTIAIDIAPGEARTELAELARQKGLALEIVEGLVVMGVLEEMADVGEEHWSVGTWERESVGA